MTTETAKSKRAKKAGPTTLPKTERATVPIESLHLADYNPRRISKEAKRGLQHSITRFGLVQDVVVNRRNMRVVGGHQRVAAMTVAGQTDVPVTFVDLDDTEEKALNVALNSQLISGEFDSEKLASLIDEISLNLPELFTELRFDELIGKPPMHTGDADNAPELDTAAPPDSVLGAVYELGPHRLICGSSTNPETWRALLGEERLQCVWTDPPYGLTVVSGSRADTPEQRRRDGGLEIQNDSLKPAALRAFLAEALGQCAAHCERGAAWYVAAHSGDLFGEFAHVLGREGLDIWRHTLIWVKDRFSMGRSDYHYRHEAVFYGWVPGGAHYFVDARTHDTVFEVARPIRNDQHPTMKPVDLVRAHIRNSSKPGWLVGDAFGGSGTTLIASALEGMRARLVELDPRYVDVIRRRWTLWADEHGVDAGSGALA
jgi:hypothetical protein